MFIGIDIGGTTIIAGLVNEEGEVLFKEEIETKAKRGYEEIEKDIITVVKELLLRSEKMEESVISIGIGIPGIADVANDYVIYCTNLGWFNVPLGIALKEAFEIPIYIDNDATVAALAESVIGATKEADSSLFITLGTGIGGGIIIDNKVFSGSHGIGSEVGHMIVGDNFYDCNCGNNGCLETFASATAINKYAIKLMEEGQIETILETRTSHNPYNLNTKLVFEAAKEGDPLANKVIKRMVKYLSIGLANLINILDPEIIAIGGGVSKAGEYLLNQLREQVPKYLLYKEVKAADIVLAKLGNDAGLVGAAMLGKK